MSSRKEVASAPKPEKKVKKSLTRAGLSFLVLTTLLGACDDISAKIPVEPTPISADYHDPEQTAETDILDETEDASPLPTEATAEVTLEEPLEIEFSGTSQLDQATQDNLDEQTSEFVTATTNSINNNPELKAALFSENGLKVPFDPELLIYHNGIWGYFAPEGGSLSNNLLIISNAEGSEGEIRFCSIDGASSVLGLGLNEQDYYLDFDHVSGQNVCLVRKESDDSVVAINDAQGQWSLPENSGLKMLTVSLSSARADGLTAVEMAQEETIQETQEAAEMDQAEIRAEILAAGVNLDDLANSENEWVSNYITIDSLQEKINNNFGKEEEGWIRTVVIGLEGVKNQEEFDQALVTDGGWKILSYAKLAYKMANGDWQIIKVPLMAYSMKDKILWRKVANTISGQYIDDKETTIEKIEPILTDPELSMDRYWELSNQFANYHSGTGSFIKLFTAWPEDPKYTNNDCIIGDPPRYSEEDLIYFRETGDPSIFGYQDSDGYYIYWPLVTFNADISKLANYNIEE
jgi:hypothetical protein